MEDKVTEEVGGESKVEDCRDVNEQEKKVESELDGGNGKSILKKPCSSSQSKKHIIDELDFGLSKKLKLNFAITPPAKSNTRKNFIKKNIKINTFHPPLPKPPMVQDESLMSELLEEGQKKKNLDIKERFYDKAESYKKKKEELKDKFDKEELSACTFMPKTNNKEKPSTKQSTFNAKLDEYISRQRKNKEKAIEDSKKLAEKVENDEQLSYKPTICEKSKEILLKKQPQEGPIYERLYNIGKGQLKVSSDSQAEPKKLNEEPEIFFHPTINEKSRNLIRTDKIENILYDDAKRRKNNPPQAAKSPTARFMGSNSEKVLIEKFKREFWDVISEVMVDSELVNYHKLTEIFKSLCFIRDDKEDIDKAQVLTLWLSLIDSETGSISKTEVLSLSLSIMGFFEDWMMLDTQFFKITKEDAQKIHKKYEQLYKNRTLVTLKSTVNQSFKNNVEYSFTPEKIAQSKELAEKWRSTHREPGSIEQSLLAEKLKKDKKLSKLKEQIEQEKLKECSFKPKTEELPKSYIKSERILDVDGKSAHKGLELYILAGKNKEKKEKLKTSKEIQEEKELEECTFKPSILEKTTGSFPSFYQRLEINSESKEKQVPSPCNNKKKLVSPRNNTKKTLTSLNSPPKTFSNTLNLQTIKETLEDDLSPKPDCLNSELEAFEKTEEMILSESLTPETKEINTNPEAEKPLSE